MPEIGKFEEKRINVVAFTNALRRLYELNPSMTALAGILGVLVELTRNITEERNKIMVPSLNEMLKREWDPQMEALRADLSSIMEDIGTHPDEADIPISQLRDNVAGALLYGRHQPYWEPDPWMRHMAVVTWAASMWNQLLEIARLNLEVFISTPPGWLVVSESLIMASKQLSKSAPGEDKTLRDKVSDGLDAVADGAEAALKGLAEIGKSAIPWFLVGIGIVVAVVVARTRQQRRSISVTVKGAK